MKIHHVLLFSFLSALCGGNTGLVSAKIPIYTGAEGGNGTIYCLWNLPKSNKFFCKEQCKGEGILIQTDGVTAKSGRYSMVYNMASSGKVILSVTITNMTKSDSALYRCGLGSSLVPDSYADFQVRVSDEVWKNSSFVQTETVGENVTFLCNVAAIQNTTFLCKSPCTKEADVLIDTSNVTAPSSRYNIKEGSAYWLYVTITRVTKSDTGLYKCGYGSPLSPVSYSWVQIIIIDAPTTSTAFYPVPTTSTAFYPAPTNSTAFFFIPWAGIRLPLVVCVSLIVVLVLTAFLLLLYIRKIRRNGGWSTNRLKDGTN